MSYSFTGFISPAFCVLILTQYKSPFSTCTILLIRSVTLIPICTVANIISLILIYILTILSIYILIKGVSKAQYYSFILLNLVLFTAATFNLMLIYILAILVIEINASRIGVRVGS